LTTAAAVHFHQQPAAIARPFAFPAPAPAPDPAPFVIPSREVGAPRVPAPAAVPRGLWTTINDSTAATTRGQLRLVRELEAALRDQIVQLLHHATETR